ncbi:MAG: hypothetical protein K940chlam2_01570, partial [Chlamydiae bacterium]|nr:hypothetical protein [Chlamydiota bacterium]
MATPNIQIDNRFAAESSGFQRVATKTNAKQSQELLHLASIVKELEQDMVDAKSGAPEAPSGKAGKGPKVVNLNAQQPQEGPHVAKSAFEQAMTELALMLQMLQVDIIKAQRNKTDAETMISESMVKLFKSIAKDIANKIAKQESNEKKDKIIGWIIKGVETAVTAIVVGIALAFGQVEIAVLMIALYIVSMSGLTKDVVKGLGGVFADILEACHVPKKDAKIIGNIIAAVVVLVAIIVATGWIAPEDIPSEVANTVTEVGSAVGEDATATAEGLSTVAEDATNGVKQVSKLRKFLRYIKLSTKANMRIMAASSTITQLNISNICVEIAEAAHKGPLSEKEKETIELIANMILAVLAVMGSIGSGDALADSMSLGEVAGGTSKAAKAIGSATEDVADSALGRMMSRISEMLQELGSEKGLVYAENMRRVLATAGAGFQGWEGGILIQQGNLDEALGKDQAAMDYVQFAVNSNSSEQSDSQKQTDATLKQQ